MNKQIWNNGLQWIDFINPSPDELKEYATQYNLDYHTLADSLEPNHLPKEERLQDITFIILRMYDKKGKKYPSSIQDMSNKIAIFYNKSVILTIHRNPTHVIEEIKAHYLEPGLIKEPSEIVTKIMLYVLKSYEETATKLSEEIDNMEKLVFVGNQTTVTLEELYYLKNSCRLNKKIITLSKEVILQHKTTAKDNAALQDVKDFLQKLSLSFDETLDDSNNLSNIYLSIMSQKTNDVMKLLTIFSVFFMPMTFIVGVYGMNFEFMPELHWKAGYPFALMLMTMIGVVIFIWFKRKRVI